MAISSQVICVENINISVSTSWKSCANKTVVMVNGAMSTAASFGWALQKFRDLNIVLYDAPCIGRSRPLNPECEFTSREIEGKILSSIASKYNADFICSMSWGGAPTLYALMANKRIKKAAIAAFSFGLSEPMKALVLALDELLRKGMMLEFAKLVNDTLGEFLPGNIKEKNYSYLSGISKFEVGYLRKHFSQVLEINPDNHIDMLKNIDAEILFINGSKDIYTDHHSVCRMRNAIRKCRIEMIDCGHFMALESKTASSYLCDMLGNFFSPVL